MQTFNIYRLNANGTGSWVTRKNAETPEQALALAHNFLGSRLVPESGTFAVINLERPNYRCTDGQILFALQRPVGINNVVPATLT